MQRKSRREKKSISASRQRKHGWHVFIRPWRFCRHALEVEQKELRVLPFWSAHAKPGVQALSHSFISNVECFYTPRNKCSQLWSQNNIPTNLSPPASTHSALVSTKCMPSTHIYRAGLNLPKAVPASAENVILCKLKWGAITESGRSRPTPNHKMAIKSIKQFSWWMFDA